MKLPFHGAGRAGSHVSSIHSLSHHWGGLGASFPSVARPLLGFFLLRVDRLIGIVAEVWPARDCGDVPKAWNQSDWQKN